MLVANALPFVREGDDALRWIARSVRLGGRAVEVEYDRRAPSSWVSCPIAATDLRDIAAHAGLVNFRVTPTRPPAYSGTTCAAVPDRDILGSDATS